MKKKLVVWLKGNIDTLLLSYLVFGGEASWAKNCRQNSWKVKEEAEKAWRAEGVHGQLGVLCQHWYRSNGVLHEWCLLAKYQSSQYTSHQKMWKTKHIIKTLLSGFGEVTSAVIVIAKTRPTQKYIERSCNMGLS